MKIRYIRNYLNGNTKNVDSHWIEIEAYTDDGTNVALNKSVTSNFTPETGTSLSYITNGNKDTTQYVYNVGGGNVFTTIDLGNIFDVKMVKMIHYYDDNRKYHDNILQVSKDGINYITMFDSNIEGEYSETSTGKDVVIRNIPEIEILNQTFNDINFSVTCDGVINKVEVLQNNIVKETYTDSFDNLTYNIDSSLGAIGNNKITIRVTYDDNYIEEEVLTHTVIADNLPTSSSLKDVIDRQELLNSTIEVQKNNLKNILVSKNVEVTEEDKFSDLIGKINELEAKKVYLYKRGDYCEDLTGGYGDYIYDKTRYSEFKKNADNMEKYIHIASSSGTYLYNYTLNKIDLTKYSKCKALVSVRNVGHRACQLRLGVYNSIPSGNDNGVASDNVGKLVSNGVLYDAEYNLEVDISNLSGSYIIADALLNINSSSSMYTHEIWLEV